MVSTRRFRFLYVFGCAAPLACGAMDTSEEPIGSISSASQDAKCRQAEPHDILIAQLMYQSVVAGYPLTQLYVDADGDIQGEGVTPDIVQAVLDDINIVPESQADVATALEKVSGEPPYEVTLNPEPTEACSGLEVWTPVGNTITDTESYSVTPVVNVRDQIQ